MNSRPYSLATSHVVRSGTVSYYQVIVCINGEKKEIGAGLSVAQLLDELGIRPGRVVVELNRDILSRDAHGATILKEGDSLEIVHFVGGG
ncbi:MAG: sulfur carrier protein ThiS [Candidatus Binatia bacterium]